MSETSVADALAGKPGEGSIVTIKGWVRTRRDSKGGFSFITVNDGSCFDSIQAVAPAALPNYQSEVMKLTTGCSVIWAAASPPAWRRNGWKTWGLAGKKFRISRRTVKRMKNIVTCFCLFSPSMPQGPRKRRR